MNIEAAREHCLSLKGVTESQPFGPTAAVYKVIDKMFALISLDENRRISLKNTPEKNSELRAKHHFIEAAWHMNKQHWSMVQLDDAHDSRLITTLIEESYALVVEKLTKKQQAILAGN